LVLNVDGLQKAKVLVFTFHYVNVDQGATWWWWGVRALLNTTTLTPNVVNHLTKFGHKFKRKVKKFKNHIIFLWHLKSIVLKCWFKKIHHNVTIWLSSHHDGRKTSSNSSKQ
jgi:hypothetical protein